MLKRMPKVTETRDRSGFLWTPVEGIQPPWTHSGNRPITVRRWLEKATWREKWTGVSWRFCHFRDWVGDI